MSDYMAQLRSKYKHPSFQSVFKKQEDYKHPTKAHKLADIVEIYGEDHCGLDPVITRWRKQ